jgi:DNA-binding response OmpR family regulator
MEAKILIVEDDEELCYLVGEELRDNGYRILLAGDGVEALQMVRNQQPDLVLLDVLMPRMDGWETCRCIREISDVPIIMLSCRSAELDKVRGLELGADDYVSKPFGHKELKARIQAALRRCSSTPVSEEIVRVDHRLVIDRTRREVFVDGKLVPLSATEYKLLACLLDHAGRVLTHQSLLTQIWGWEYAEETDYLKVYVHHLRRKLEEDAGQPRYILSERGVGYSFQFPLAI